MSIAAERRQSVVSEYRINSKDSGSPDVQIAMLTEEISSLAEHLQSHKKDNSSRRGLVLKVAKRNRLLKYLAHCDRDRYTGLIGRLGLRK
jgi:small subunit ribosomal protein S15